MPLVLPDTGFVKAEKVSTLLLVFPHPKYFPSKQAYFIYEEPLQWTTMSPKNKSLKAELLEI